MEPMAVVRKVTKDVLIFVCHKQGIIAEQPCLELSFVPEITAEFMRNLSRAIWIDSYGNEYVWENFFRNHFHRMTASPYRFANYVSYACYLFNKGAENAYESFTNTLALVIHFVMHSWHKGRTEYLNTCVDLFCDFFEQEILSKFQDEGGWKYFNEYLVKNHGLLSVCDDLIKAGHSPYELFKELEIEFREMTEIGKIGGVLLKDVTESQVLDDKKASSFADSVSGKIQKLVCKQTIKEILADFKKADQRVEELYRQMTGEATGGIETQDSNVLAVEDEQSSAQKDKDVVMKSSEGKQSSLQKDREVSRGKMSKSQASPSQTVPEASENVPKQTIAKKKKQKATLPPTGFDSPKSQDLKPEAEELCLNTKLTRVEKAKILLKSMLDDINIVRELIKFLCVEQPMQAADAVA